MSKYFLLLLIRNLLRGWSHPNTKGRFQVVYPVDLPSGIRDEWNLHEISARVCHFSQVVFGGFYLLFSPLRSCTSFCCVWIHAFTKEQFLVNAFTCYLSFGNPRISRTACLQWVLIGVVLFLYLGVITGALRGTRFAGCFAAFLRRREFCARGTFVMKLTTVTVF